jgi:hypothetical protein
LHCLSCFGAPPQYIGWIRECISTPNFSIAMNGTLVGFFHAKKGLKQGDPLSPYLFVLAMECISLLLEKMAASSSLFSFHLRCSLIKLTHLCFAEDLLIFSAAFSASVQAVNNVLGEFETLSRLKANPSKSYVFIVGFSQDEKNELL